MHIIKEEQFLRKRVRPQMKIFVAEKYFLKMGGNIVSEDIRDVTILGRCTVEYSEGVFADLEFGTVKYAGQKIKVVGLPDIGYTGVTNLGKY